MKYINMIHYVIYMVILRIKGVKRDYIEKHKGERAAWEYGQDVFLKWSLFTIKIIGMDIVIEGKENIPKETCVFMGNHQSILDIPTLRYAVGRPLDFVAKKELAKAPFIGYWITHLKSVSLDRENPREGIKAIGTAIKNIKEGYNFTIFPEGTRSKDGKIGEFKKGSIKLATKTNAPIVPFSIKGTSACFEDTKNFVPGKVVIKFGQPIYINSSEKVEEGKLIEEVRNSVCKMYDEE